MGDGCPCGTYKVWLLSMTILSMISAGLLAVTCILGLSITAVADALKPLFSEKGETEPKDITLPLIISFIICVIGLGFSALPILAEKMNKPRLFTPWIVFLFLSLLGQIYELIQIIVKHKETKTNAFVVEIGALAYVSTLIFLSFRRRKEMYQNNILAIPPHMVAGETGDLRPIQEQEVRMDQSNYQYQKQD